MPSGRRPLAWLKGEIKSPPFSPEARVRAGFLLGRLQEGATVGMPESRPMPSIGPRCHELRVRDRDHFWRIVYRIDPDAIVIADVFAKKTGKTPVQVIANCKGRLRDYDRVARGER